MTTQRTPQPMETVRRSPSGPVPVPCRLIAVHGGYGGYDGYDGYDLIVHAATVPPRRRTR
ncbi:hypothetical protein OHA98_21055 [Streptomyces sp. NBC_00654]|uniref:hypothetical protein n=1 Tax=Streptomyces sp. NBC_00654 TaxID=2975799 RepID=UPI0022526BCA|nr:hypothetical protein [Streptomyces sp. NBC_00654]MCX4967213.1 hypothetical protein [Streptomyces sp. NBC_00654]